MDGFLFVDTSKWIYRSIMPPEGETGHGFIVHTRAPCGRSWFVNYDPIKDIGTIVDDAQLATPFVDTYAAEAHVKLLRSSFGVEAEVLRLDVPSGIVSTLIDR